MTAMNARSPELLQTWIGDPPSVVGCTNVIVRDASGVIASVAAVYVPYHLVSAASTNATLVSASARRLGFVTAYNANAAPRYLKIYDKATAPTVGTDVPILTFMIPGNSQGAGAGNNVPLLSAFGLSNGLAFALTAGMADNDSTAIGASDVVIDLGYV